MTFQRLLAACLCAALALGATGCTPPSETGGTYGEG
jgi:hypothetical protein